MWCEIALPAVGALGLITGMYLESKFNPRDWGQKEQPDEHELWATAITKEAYDRLEKKLQFANKVISDYETKEQK